MLMRDEEGRQGNYMYVIITYAHAHDLTMKLNIISREFV